MPCLRLARIHRRAARLPPSLTRENVRIRFGSTTEPSRAASPEAGCADEPEPLLSQTLVRIHGGGGRPSGRKRPRAPTARNAATPRSPNHQAPGRCMWVERPGTSRTLHPSPPLDTEATVEPITPPALPSTLSTPASLPIWDRSHAGTRTTRMVRHRRRDRLCCPRTQRWPNPPGQGVRGAGSSVTTRRRLVEPSADGSCLQRTEGALCLLCLRLADRDRSVRYMGV
jgi:hypothetical protein